MLTASKYVTAAEVAQALGVHRFSVYRWVAERRIIGAVRGLKGRLLIPATEIKRLALPRPRRRRRKGRR